jgi:hypothetical protein
MNDYEKALREEGESPLTLEQLRSLRPVKARVAKDVRAVFSLRLSADELREISEAAEGSNIGDFIRTAALKAAREKRGYDQAVASLIAAQELLQSAIREVGGQYVVPRRKRKGRLAE